MEGLNLVEVTNNLFGMCVYLKHHFYQTMSDSTHQVSEFQFLVDLSFQMHFHLDVYSLTISSLCVSVCACVLGKKVC